MKFTNRDLFFDIYGFKLEEEYRFLFEALFLCETTKIRPRHNNGPKFSNAGYAAALLYGLDGLGPKTYREAGRLMPRSDKGMGVTPERMRQMWRNDILKMRGRHSVLRYILKAKKAWLYEKNP